MFDRLPYDLQRIRLRALRQADAGAFHAYRCDPEVARFQGWAPMTDREASDFVAAQACHRCLTPGAWHQLGIAYLDSDLLIGDAGVWLSPDSSQAEIGLSISSAAQGQGFGSECLNGLIDLLFAATNVAEIVGNADTRNPACLAVLARSAMRHVETRQAEYKGEVCIEHAFSVRRA